MEECLMTRENVQDFLAMIQGAYPNYNPADKTATINAWTMALEDYDKDQVACAFKIYMQTNTSGFAPTPGQLIQHLHTITKPQQLNEMEAWSLVSKAIRNSSYNSVEEFAKLPSLVQKAVGQPEQLRIWALDENYNEVVISSNFIKCYRSELARADEISKMPVEAQRMIESVNCNRGIEVKPYVAIEESIEHDVVPIPNGFKQKLEEMLG